QLRVDVVPGGGGRRHDGREPPERTRGFASAAVPELPGRSGRDRAAAGRPGDQPSGGGRHHRRVRIGADRAAGDPAMNRIAANPIPYWLAGGKTREVFEEAF